MGEANTLTTFIPNRNYGKYLREATFSVLNQSRPPEELLLIDDASLDQSVEEMTRIQRTYAGKTVIQVKSKAKHEGHIATYNKAILAATGSLVHLMASDDVILDPSFYSEAIKILNEDPDCLMVFGGLRIMDEVGVQNGTTVLPPIEGMHEGKTWLQEMIKYGNFVCGGAVIIRTSSQRDTGNYDARLPHAADWMNWIRVFGTGKKAFGMKKVVYGYRRHRMQMTWHKNAPESERIKCFEAIGEKLRAL